MITTITFNPAIDKTMIIDNLRVGRVNRESGLRIDAAGKGINVSKVIQKLGGKSVAMGILAGNSGKFIKDELDKIGIENDFLFIEGQTRTNVKVVDGINNLVTDINENGPFVSADDLKAFEKKVIDNLSKDSIAVFSGSIPRNVDKKVYKRLISKAKEKGVKTILDADGELLIEGLKAGPHLVKPNIHELEKIFSKSIESIEDIIKYGKKLLEYGVEHVIVSRGGEGSVFISKEKIAIVDGIKVEVKSTVGAGDSMVAAISLAIDKDYSFETTIKLSVAASAASVMKEGTQSGSIEDINKLIDKVEFKMLMGDV
ncbi:1-phosphofructokinase [Wukongibacter sp. M2B1]|uniref:1-phosphofructokinase n=1 Tax=Wukongibacter sp. M2B1 TaxID=3088895 RepID=UPI003D7A7B25